MIGQLRLATIWSEDLNHLLPFYRDTLGLEVGIEGDGFVAFGDIETPSLALGTHSDVRGPNRDPARHMVGFAVDDVNAEYQRLKDAGVEFIEAPGDVPDGIPTATLKDPEGNLVQLFQFS